MVTPMSAWETKRTKKPSPREELGPTSDQTKKLSTTKVRAGVAFCVSMGRRRAVGVCLLCDEDELLTTIGGSLQSSDALVNFLSLYIPILSA